MQEKIDLIKNKVETLEINELRHFLEMELNEARQASKKSEAEKNLVHVFYGTEQNHYFDKLAFFIESTKKFKYSLIDCDDKLKNNEEKYNAINADILCKVEFFQSLKSRLKIEIEGMLKNLTNGSLISVKDELPLHKILAKFDSGEKFDLDEMKGVIEGSHYKPKDISSWYNSFYVIPGQFEVYSTHRSKALDLLREIGSDNFKEKEKDFLSQLKKKERLGRIPFKIRTLKVSWRQSLSDCFKVKYEERQLNPHSLLINGNC